MNEDVKKRWVDRLRSGALKQGTGALRIGDEFCCLGVLCELAVEAGVIPPPQAYGSVYSYGVEDDTNDMVLPVSVLTWAELDTCNPVVGNWRLADYNDGVREGDDDDEDDSEVTLKKHTFAEIADLIEKIL